MKSNLYKKESKIHGLGIFTNAPILKNAVIYKVPLNKIYHAARKKCAFIGNNMWVDDEKILNFINHSCNANAKLDLSDKPQIIAKRKIKTDEEITVDYDQTELNGTKMICCCKSKKCKKYFLTIQ
ncbi:SET domain-containing protein-lysine N-methyltransferase [Candidatus Nomurabacteria bacterium]|nr:SET domain-containing protein-lysine N-methyltransferase [Candidatus Nomurabacteria bacterium]